MQIDVCVVKAIKPGLRQYVIEHRHDELDHREQRATKAVELNLADAIESMVEVKRILSIWGLPSNGFGGRSPRGPGWDDTLALMEHSTVLSLLYENGDMPWL